MDKRNNVLLGCLCALGCETLYGLSYVFTKQATNIGSELALLGWRFFVAAIVMTILVALGAFKVNLKGKKKGTLILVGLFCPCIYFLGETIGISNTTATESGVLLACIPVASLIASTIILKKKPSKFQIIGIATTLVGVIITVVFVGITSSLSIIGYLFLLIGVVSYALYSVYVDKAQGFSGIEITYVMLVMGAVLFIILALGEGIINGNVSQLLALPFKETGFLTAIIYQGIGCSIFAFLLSNLAISNIGVNKTSSFIGWSTVVSIVAGVIILGESFKLCQIIGAVIIIGGIYIANIKQ